MDVRPFNRNISLTQCFDPGYSLADFSFKRFTVDVNGNSSKSPRKIKANWKNVYSESKSGQLRL